jgi:hypothetical protein
LQQATRYGEIFKEMDHLVLIGEVGVKADRRHYAKTGRNKRYGPCLEARMRRSPQPTSMAMESA